MIDVGERIRKLRKERGISAKEIAVSLGVSPSFIPGIDKGKYKCSLESLDKICTVLGITLHDFFEPDKQATELPPDIRRLVDLANRLTPKQREILLAAAEECARLNSENKGE